MNYQNWKNNCIEPEVHSPFQDFENDVSKFFSFVPFVGSVYQLITSGFIVCQERKKWQKIHSVFLLTFFFYFIKAKKRLLNGPLKLVYDVVYLQFCN